MRFTLFTENSRLGTRLAAGLGVLIAFGVIEGVVALQFMDQIEDRVANIYTQELVVLEALDDVKSAAYRIRGDVLEHILAEGSASQQRLSMEISQQQARIRDRLAEYRTTRLATDEIALLDAFESHFRTYTERIEAEILPLSTAGRKAEAEVLARSVAVAEFREAREAMNDLMDYNLERGRVRYDNAIGAYRLARWMTVLFVILASFAGFVIAWRLTRAVTRPLTQLIGYLTEIGEGRLDEPIEFQRADEFGEVFKALNATRERLAQFRTEERLRTRELETLGTAIANLPHPVLILSPNGTVLSANPAVTRVYGYLPNELIGRSAQVLLGGGRIRPSRTPTGRASLNTGTRAALPYLYVRPSSASWRRVSFVRSSKSTGT